MRKALKIAALVFVLLAVLIQFIRPAKNDLPPAASTPDELFVMYPPPLKVRQIIVKACFDCHSDRTNYPWYAEIQPAGWWLAGHIRDGKAKVNFSRFRGLPAKRVRTRLEDCIDQMQERKMPLPSYTWIHGDARLSNDEIKTVVTWLEETIERIEEPDSK